MQRILVINPKGGSGKTTLATNLASLFSNRGKITTLMDLDPQGSSVFWALNRPDSAPHIQLVDAHNCPQNVTRSWAIQPPRNTEVLVLDTPARPDMINLRPLLQEATAILLPVLLAEFDLHAIANTVAQLSRVLRSREAMALVVNRSPLTEQAKCRSEELGRELDLPVIATLRDSRNFVKVVTEGKGVCEMKGSHYRGDRREVEKIGDWCCNAADRRQGPSHIRPNPTAIAMAGSV